MPPPTPPPPSPEEDPQDLATIAAIRRGDAAAWNSLILRHQDRIFSICVRMVHNRDLATDLAQDVFVKIIQGLDSFDGRAKLSTWMTRIAMNVCLSKLRSEKLRRHASIEAMSEARSGASPDYPAHRGMELEQSREPGQDSSVEAHEDRERMLAALRHLDPDQRALLILCDCQGHSYEQIAEVMGIAVGTVKSRIFRARAALRDAVDNPPLQSVRRETPSTQRQ